MCLAYYTNSIFNHDSCEGLAFSFHNYCMSSAFGYYASPNEFHHDMQWVCIAHTLSQDENASLHMHSSFYCTTPLFCPENIKYAHGLHSKSVSNSISTAASAAASWYCSYSSIMSVVSSIYFSYGVLFLFSFFIKTEKPSHGYLLIATVFNEKDELLFPL